MCALKYFPKTERFEKPSSIAISLIEDRVWQSMVSISAIASSLIHSVVVFPLISLTTAVRYLGLMHSAEA